jgi:hypothetical protein
MFIERLPPEAMKRSPAGDGSRRSLAVDLRPNRITQKWRELKILGF